MASEQPNLPAASLFFGILLLPLIIMSFSSGSAPGADDDIHGHAPNSFPSQGLASWTDPFTTSSTTFVVLTGLSISLQARTAAQGLQVLLLGNVFCHVSAGASAEIDIFVDGSDGGIGVRVINTGFQEISIFLTAPSVFNDMAVHTFDLRVEVNSALSTFTAQGVDPLAGSTISYLSGVDLGTGPPIVPQESLFNPIQEQKGTTLAWSSGMLSLAGTFDLVLGLVLGVASGNLLYRFYLRGDHDV